MPRTMVTQDELRAARALAVDAGLEADALEARARAARRKATSRTKHYEDLMFEYQGQMTLPYDAEEAP